MATRGKFADDPLVPIRGDRIAAALRRSGWTVSGLASRAQASQQTVDLIVRGVTSRCRRSLRAALARALATTADALSGANPPQFGSLVLRVLGDAGDLAETPVALRELMLAVQRAATRDHLPVYADGTPPIIRQLLDPLYWRSLLFKGEHNVSDLPPQERDQLGALLADALRLLLKPWFDGRARLRRSTALTQTDDPLVRELLRQVRAKRPRNRKLPLRHT